MSITLIRPFSTCVLIGRPIFCTIHIKITAKRLKLHRSSLILFYSSLLVSFFHLDLTLSIILVILPLHVHMSYYHLFHNCMSQMYKYDRSSYHQLNRWFTHSPNLCDIFFLLRFICKCDRHLILCFHRISTDYFQMHCLLWSI